MRVDALSMQQQVFDVIVSLCCSTAVFLCALPAGTGQPHHLVVYHPFSPSIRLNVIIIHLNRVIIATQGVAKCIQKNILNQYTYCFNMA